MRSDSRTAFFACSRCSTRARSRGVSKGFERKVSMPSRAACVSVSLSSRAVTMMIGIDAKAGIALMRRHISIPDMTGIISSVRINSGRKVGSRASPARPFEAIWHSQRSERISRMSSATARLSSTMRIRGLAGSSSAV